MSFKNYAELQAEIKSFLWDREDIAARIPSFISLAETEARRLLRTSHTNATKPFTFSGRMAIPCGTGTVLAVRVNDGDTTWRELDYLSPESFAMAPRLNDIGRPRYYTVQDERIQFAPYGDDGQNGLIVYSESFEPLSSTCDCNWLLKQHPDIYLAGALKWGKAWLIDGDWDWATPFYAAIEAANRYQPRVQTNTTLRADAATQMASRGRFNIRTGGFD